MKEEEVSPCFEQIFRKKTKVNKPKIAEDLPELMEIEKETRTLSQKIRELKQIRETLYEEFAKKAHETYKPHIEKLYEQISQLFVTDQDIKLLELEVLNKLNKVLDKY